MDGVFPNCLAHCFSHIWIVDGGESPGGESRGAHRRGFILKRDLNARNGEQRAAALERKQQAVQVLDVEAQGIVHRRHERL